MRNEAQELYQCFMIITITPTPQHGVVVASLTLHSHLQFSQLTTLGPMDSESPQHFSNLAERKNFWPAIPNPMTSRFLRAQTSLRART